MKKNSSYKLVRKYIFKINNDNIRKRDKIHPKQQINKTP